MFPLDPLEEPLLKVEIPARACNVCGAPMGYLADLCEIGARPAERIFLCRHCKNVIAELL